MSETILVALGGNAIKQANERGTAEEQRRNIQVSCEQISRIIAAGHKLAITHGNGPQAGNLLIQQEEGAAVVPAMPLDVVGAMTQGQLGYMFSQELAMALRRKGIEKDVVALVNQVCVDPKDPAFDDPTKPVGPFFTEAQAAELAASKPDWQIKEVKPKSVEKRFRRVVASPKPVDNVEKSVISTLVQSGVVVIASGGGGVPVSRDADGNLKGEAAVIDKDAAGAMLGALLGATTLLILTDVSHALLDYGKPNQRPIETVTRSEMIELAKGGDFLAGSMGPKVQAGLDFIAAGGKRCIITSLEHAYDAITDGYGTQIVAD